VSNASVWMIEVRDGFSLALKGRYAWKNGSVQLEAGSVQVELARLEGDITMIFDRVVSDEYYNCVEATFNADMGVLPLDIVTIYLEVEGIYRARFKGRAQLTQNPDDPYPDLVPHRVVGLLEDWAISSNQTVHPPNTDLAQLVVGALSSDTTNAIDLESGSVPTAGISLPTAYSMGYVPITEVLADLAGRTSKKFLYGVNGKGVFYFLEKPSQPATPYSQSSEWSVVYPQLQTQEYYDKVRWVISSGTVTNLATLSPTTLETPDLLTHVSVSPQVGTFFSKTKVLDVPSNVLALKPITPTGINVSLGDVYASFLGTLQDSSPDLSRLHDLNPASYVVFRDSTPTLIGRRQLKIDYSVPFNTYRGKDIVAVRLNLKLDAFNTDTKNFFEKVTIDLDFQNGLTFSSQRVGFANDGDFPNLGDLILVAGDRARAVDANTTDGNAFIQYGSLKITWDGSSEVGGTSQVGVDAYIAVESFVLYAVNKEELDRLAEKEYRLRDETSLLIHRESELLPFSPKLTFNRGDLEPLSNLEPLQYRYVISGEPTEDGPSVGTTITVGYFATFGPQGLNAQATRKRDREAQQKAVQKSLSYNR
jgi:hypothetical protein